MTAHPLVLEAAALGIRIEADGAALVVAPASLLTDELRARIVAAKPALLEALAADEDGAGDTDRNPARWLRFKALCIGRGVRPGELARHFPGIEDRDDIACSTDDALDTLAEHMAAVILVERRERAVAELLDAVDGAAGTERVQCGACRHFARFEGRPHDGTCRVGAGRSPVTWGSSWIACESHERDDAAAARLEHAA